MSAVCAIDFGTSNSAIALPTTAGAKPAVQLVELEPGQRTMPTAVFYAVEGLAAFEEPHCYYGRAAVAAYVTHGVLSGGAVARVGASPLEHLIITDSIQATEAVRVSRNVEQLTIAPLMAEAIRRISDESSVSSLFD